VYEDRFVAEASPDYLALHGVPRTPDDLAGHQCLGLWSAARGGVIEWAFEKDGRRTTVVPGGRLSVNDAEALIDAAVAGAGILMMLELLTRRWIASGALQAVLEDWRPGDTTPISLVYPQNRHLSAKVRAFGDFVAGLFPRRRSN
jgi:LysR family transcriptional regulator for bpeEF and oprC